MMVDLSVHMNWEIPRKLVKHTSLSVWDLVGKLLLECGWQHPLGWGPGWSNQQNTKLLGCHTWFFSSRCAFAAATIHDIRLKILQSWDGAAPHGKFALNLLASHAEWLAGSQVGLSASEHGSFLIKYTSHWFCSLGKNIPKTLSNTVGRAWAPQEVHFPCWEYTGTAVEEGW